MSDALRIAAGGMYAAGMRLDATAGRIAASGLAPVAPEVGGNAALPRRSMSTSRRTPST